MDPCPFVRLTVGNLALKVPVAAKASRSVVHPSSSPCFCKIKLKHFSPQTAAVPHIPPDISDGAVVNKGSPPAATFYLSKEDLERVTGKSSLSLPLFANGKISIKISIYTGHAGATCGVNAGRLLGKVVVPVELSGAESRGLVVFHNGWIGVGKKAQFHLNVRAEPDPRFVFQFDGEPECSPQVFQIRGSIRQPVFTCNFSFRNTAGDRNQRCRSLPSSSSSEQGKGSSGRGWLVSFGSERERLGKERKGWSVTVHDLSGSPVAAASMVTPFVASPGSDRVSRSNPGSWLILRPGDGTWKPWGRLEAWRERGGTSDGLGYRFELIPGTSAAGVVLAESTLSVAKGGKFSIDLSKVGGLGAGAVGLVGTSSPACGGSSSPSPSPRGRAANGNGSGDRGYSLWPYGACRGFVMSARVDGERSKRSNPTVELGVQHVTCTEDAAAYVALAAAVDLSMDACRLFSQRLRKELCQKSDDHHCHRHFSS